ncbi:MAG: BrnT family toxin [Candidatus Scalindua sp.]|nr:BrnT family toxin [Candidatus Scalindua sp.]MCR4344204.1 BrnT family toxin [Candidatus Scalindua sp.]
MNSISFVWDKKKANANYKKHKVTFEEAKTVFIDPNGRMIYDPGHSNDEERFILLGVSSALRILAVCHCYRKENQVIRIISARKATKTEQKQYRSFLP